MTDEELVHRFTYHSPKEGQPERYIEIRAKALELALLINKLTPESREQSIAFTELDIVVWAANAAIARRD